MMPTIKMKPSHARSTFPSFCTALPTVSLIPKCSTSLQRGIVWVMILSSILTGGRNSQPPAQSRACRVASCEKPSTSALRVIAWNPLFGPLPWGSTAFCHSFNFEDKYTHLTLDNILYSRHLRSWPIVVHFSASHWEINNMSAKFDSSADKRARRSSRH